MHAENHELAPARTALRRKARDVGPRPVTVNGTLLVPVPNNGVVTVTGPLVAPFGMKTLIWVPSGLPTQLDALVPLNFTDDAFVKCTPKMAISSPTDPRFVEKPVITERGW